MLVNVTSKRGKVRPLLRVAALLSGLLGVAASPLVVVFGFPQWNMILTGVCGFVMSVFFIYVGLTGENFDEPDD